MRPDFVPLAFASLLAFGLFGCLSYHPGPIPGEPDGATFAELRGVRIRYLDQGPRDAPAVLLIHGFASAIEEWNPVVPALLPEFRVIAFDLKGFGYSGRPEGDYSPAEHARIALALLDELGVSEVAVVAHSYGASVALALALESPERVSRLALYDAWVYEEQLPPLFLWARHAGIGETIFALYYTERSDERMASAFYDPSQVSEALVEQVGRVLEWPGTRAAALATVRDMDYAAVEDRYVDVTQPTLLLWGEDDEVAPLSIAHRLLGDLPAAELRTFGRCGHLPMVEATEASNAALRRFLLASDESGCSAELGE